MSYNSIAEINVPVTGEGINALREVDESFIGTPDYMGIAYFWHYDFRHYLRDSSRYRRRLVHKNLVAAGLEPAGNSAKHWRVVLRYARPEGRSVAHEPVTYDCNTGIFKPAERA